MFKITLELNGAELMATFQEVMTRLGDISTSLSNIRTDIQGLKDTIANGGAVSQQQLDDLMNQVNAVATQASDVDNETP